VPAETVATVGKNFGSLLVVVTGNTCSTGANGDVITVTDSIGRVATLTIGNTLGTAVRPAGGAAVALPVPTLTPGTFAGFLCGQSSSVFVNQTIPSGYTGTPPVLSAVALEPNRITANLSNGILTVTRPATDPGGAAQTRVRVSNGTNFTDLTIDLAGAAPFACTTTGGSASPITVGTGSALGVTIAGRPTVNVTFDGGTGPYTITSASPAYFQVSLDGVTFGTSVTVPSGGAKLYFVRSATVVGGVPATGNASFITITDSSTPAQTFVQIVTMN
jgi:hypothetical protein